MDDAELPEPCPFCGFKADSDYQITVNPNDVPFDVNVVAESLHSCIWKQFIRKMEIPRS